MNRNQMMVAALALVILPGVASAQTDTGQRSRRTTTERGGSVTRGGRGQGSNMGLSGDQMTQFQQSLSDMGCYRGSVDGMMGPQTRQAVACARQRNNLQGNNMNELFRSMNLDMTVQDSMGMDVMGSSGRGRRGGGNRMRDTSGGAGGSEMSDSGATNRRGGAANRGRSGNAGRAGNAGTAGNSGRRTGRDSGGTRPPRP
ncbi:MAG TPA: peptidoglycan-binding domain-containing protein [Gemmatimonadaceae bacterium]|nr:peptidoglycan-binding domain-containing protein [Gemmatimonadaceae bacterium]